MTSGSPTDSAIHRSILTEATRILIPFLILAAGAGVLALSVALRPEPEQKVREVLIPLVQTSRIRSYDKPISIDVDGTVVPFRQIMLPSEISGRVLNKRDACRAGNEVLRGDLLIELDPMDYQLEVRRLAKEFAQAKSALRESEVELANARASMQLGGEEVRLQRREVDRLQKLVGRRIVAETEVDRALSNEVSAQNQVLTKQNEIRSIEARQDRLAQAIELAATRLEQAEINLKRTKIAAPIDGVIVRDMVEEDGFVKAGDTLFEIEDTSACEVLCKLRMEQLSWLWQHAPADAVLASQQLGGSQPNDDTVSRGGRAVRTTYEVPQVPATVTYRLGNRRYEWKGVLSRFDGIGLDERTRMVPCRVLVPDPRDVKVVRPGVDDPVVGVPALVRGMYVTVSLEVTADEVLYEIPAQALQPGNFVWKVQESKLQVFPVDLAKLTDDGVALIRAKGSQLRIGDSLVISPLPNAKDGMTIQVQAEVAGTDNSPMRKLSSQLK